MLLGAGLGLHLLTRPYESDLSASGSVILFFAPILRKPDALRFDWRDRLAVASLALAGHRLTLLQNKP